MRSSDSLLYNRNPSLDLEATKVAVPKLKLENVMESTNDDLGEFTTVENEDKEQERGSDDEESQET